MNSSTKRSLTGIRSSGNVHLGNYLGMIKPALSRQKDYQCLYFIADMHALTSNKDPGMMRRATLDLVATWLALGFDSHNHLLYRQSDLPMVGEFSWYLSCCIGMGLLEKAHAYKDAATQNREVNHGIFAYPVLMAADILMYDTDIVPVGKDQKQHVEMARDMAGSFNSIYGEGLLKLPEPLLQEEVMLIPGLDGRKMSKSYGNEIPLWAEERELRKLIMAIKTDSTPLEAPKSLKGTLLSDFLSVFSDEAHYRDLEERLARGGLGWGHAKAELADLINSQLKDVRATYKDLRSDEQKLLEVLDNGAQRAFEIGSKVLDRVRAAVGFGKFRYRPTF